MPAPPHLNGRFPLSREWGNVGSAEAREETKREQGEETEQGRKQKTQQKTPPHSPPLPFPRKRESPDSSASGANPPPKAGKNKIPAKGGKNGRFPLSREWRILFFSPNSPHPSFFHSPHFFTIPDSPHPPHSPPLPFPRKRESPDSSAFGANPPPKAGKNKIPASGGQPPKIPLSLESREEVSPPPPHRPPAPPADKKTTPIGIFLYIVAFWSAKNGILSGYGRPASERGAFIPTLEKQMKKKALTLAIAAALSAPASFAATDDSGMRYTSASEGFYASLRVQLQTKTSKTGKASIGNEGSRMGVRGTSDLGGGLEGFYRWETAININDADGSGVGGTRLGNVGVRGAFGQIQMGSFWTNDYNWVGVITDVGTAARAMFITTANAKGAVAKRVGIHHAGLERFSRRVSSFHRPGGRRLRWQKFLVDSTGSRGRILKPADFTFRRLPLARMRPIARLKRKPLTSGISRRSMKSLVSRLRLPTTPSKTLTPPAT